MQVQLTSMQGCQQRQNFYFCIEQFLRTTLGESNFL
jgi:hypothetical protein